MNQSRVKNEAAADRATPDHLLARLADELRHGELERSLAQMYPREKISGLLDEICRAVTPRKAAENFFLLLVLKSEEIVNRLPAQVDANKRLAKKRREISGLSAKLAKALAEETELRRGTILRQHFERDLLGLVLDAVQAAGRLAQPEAAQPRTFDHRLRPDGSHTGQPSTVDPTWWPSLLEVVTQLAIDRKRPLSGHLDSPSSAALKSRKTAIVPRLVRALDEVAEIFAAAPRINGEAGPQALKVSATNLATLIECATAGSSTKTEAVSAKNVEDARAYTPRDLPRKP